MGIALIKGQKIDLTKNRINLDYLYIGIDWSAPSNLDIDASAFLLDGAEKIISDESFIFYGHPQSSDQSIRLEESDTTIEKQHFMTSLKKMPRAVEKVAFTLTIYEAKLKNLTFSDVKDIKVRIISSQTQEEIATFSIDYAFAKESAIVLGTLYRYNNEWKFHAVGAGFDGGLADLCQLYGLEVIEESQAPNPEETEVPPNDRFQQVQERDVQERGEAIPPEPQPEAVELKRDDVVHIDMDRAGVLSRESRVLEGLFEDREEPPQTPPIPEFQIPESTNFIQQTETDNDGFIESLTGTEKEFLNLFTNGELPVTEALLFSREHATMPAMYLNSINEKSGEHFDEILLNENEDFIVVDEEFYFVIEEIKERVGNEH